MGSVVMSAIFLDVRGGVKKKARHWRATGPFRERRGRADSGSGGAHRRPGGPGATAGGDGGLTVVGVDEAPPLDRVDDRGRDLLRQRGAAPAPGAPARAGGPRGGAAR